MIAFPSLPDDVNKLFLTLSVILIGFGFYSIYFPQRDYKWEHELEKRKMEIVNERYALFNQINLNKYEMVSVSERVSKRYGVTSPFILVNDSLVETRRFDSIPADSIIQDSLYFLSADLSILSKKYLQSFEKENYVQGLLYSVDDYTFENVVGAVGCISLGLFLFYTGLKGWRDHSMNVIKPGEKPIKNYSLYCQSCARNFTHFLKRGTTKKGKKSKLFCSDCYSNGEFTDFLREETIEEYKLENLRDRKRKDRKRIKQRFNSLLRWKKDEFQAA